jgi:large subunit ribosomal protein L35
VGKKYKLKTHKGTAKRFRVTGSGKIVRTKGGKSHFRRRQSFRSKNMLSKAIIVTTPSEKKRVLRLAPYLKLYRVHPPS